MGLGFSRAGSVAESMAESCSFAVPFLFTQPLQMSSLLSPNPKMTTGSHPYTSSLQGAYSKTQSSPNLQERLPDPPLDVRGFLNRTGHATWINAIELPAPK